MKARFTQASFVRAVLPYVVAIVAVVVIAIVVVVRALDPDRRQLGLELVKSLVQVATVLVLGQVFAVVVKDREDERDLASRAMLEDEQRQTALTALRTELLVKLSGAFVRVKGSRRLLRAGALTLPWDKELDDKTEIRSAAYNSHMQAINEVELELESLWHQLDATNTESAERVALVGHVKAMKDYLREILHQYEQMMPEFAGANGSLSAARFRDASPDGTLLDLLNPDENTGFKLRFVQHFREASRTLRASLLAAKAEPKPS
ncbi:MAG TPA: hypothetical protein VHX14_00640 [Thermoanaerobaculia bacterium]|jgi:hypothetical protein|nr:hypothetical protein [Thermoanaerobaculia bacterium]